MKWATARVALVIALIAAVAGCGGSSSSPSPATETSSSSDGELTVFAAASLTEVLQSLDGDAIYQFAASDTLATQLTEGADADVFAAANTRLPDALHDEGIVDRPVPFATNHVVLVVPEDSPLESLEDLKEDDETRLVMAADGVPLGDYTVKVLEALEAGDLVERASSRERDAKAVVSKVVLGEADAGFVYATDARVSDDELRVIELPPTDANRAVYSMAVVSGSSRKDLAQEYVDLITSDAGRAALEDAGFGVS